MILPRKYMDLKHSVLNITAIILEELIKLDAVSLVELNEVVVVKLGPNANVNFLAAINTLYLFGKIEYDESSDVIIYDARQGENQ